MIRNFMKRPCPELKAEIFSSRSKKERRTVAQFAPAKNSHPHPKHTRIGFSSACPCSADSDRPPPSSSSPSPLSADGVDYGGDAWPGAALVAEAPRGEAPVTDSWRAIKKNIYSRRMRLLRRRSPPMSPPPPPPPPPPSIAFAAPSFFGRNV